MADSLPRGVMATQQLDALRSGKTQNLITTLEFSVDDGLVGGCDLFSHPLRPLLGPLWEFDVNPESYAKRLAQYRKGHSSPFTLTFLQHLPNSSAEEERIRGTERAVLYADTLACSDDDLYVEAFPPRSRIRPVMELPDLVAEMKEVEPSALEQGWEGNGGWDNWATVSVYAGPLTKQDAEYATARPIIAMKRTLEQYLFPLTNPLLNGDARA